MMGMGTKCQSRDMFSSSRPAAFIVPILASLYTAASYPAALTMSRNQLPPGHPSVAESNTLRSQLQVHFDPFLA